jgi:uncharacterized membrane protein
MVERWTHHPMESTPRHRTRIRRRGLAVCFEHPSTARREKTMGSHSHSHRVDEVAVGRVPRTALLSVLALAGLATVIGLWVLWADSSQAPHIPKAAAFAAPGVTLPHARVTQVQPACPTKSTPTSVTTCGHITARLDLASGGHAQVIVDVPAEVAHSGLRAGDTVQLIRTAPGHGQPASYTYFSTDRHISLFWLTALFAALVVGVARLRGLLALVALAFSGWMITQFMLPALLAGESGGWVALVGSSAIMFVVLYLTHGPSVRTSAALAGTLAGISVTAGIGLYAIHASRLTGVPDETGGILSSFVNDLSLTGLLTSGLIVAGLGVLNDVTITQSSAVWELRSAAPDLPRRAIFASAMRIGRDHIASTIYTIVFAYTGASIIVLLLLDIYNRPALDLISSEAIAEEIVRTLASGIGLVLAVPITTAIAAAVASPGVPRAPRPGPLEPIEDRSGI